MSLLNLRTTLHSELNVLKPAARAIVALFQLRVVPQSEHAQSEDFLPFEFPLLSLFLEEVESEPLDFLESLFPDSDLEPESDFDLSALAAFFYESLR